MANPDYGFYLNNNNNNNNNSYLPSLRHPSPFFPLTATSHMPSSIYQNSQIGQNVTSNFTFTSPTQTNVVSYASPMYTASVSTTHSPYHGPRTAPGTGARWQHTVPQQMPWMSTVPQSSSPVIVFTAQSSQSTAFQQSSLTSKFEPKASCSFTQRRPKRHSELHYNTSMCPSSKVRITDEKMAARMEGLNLTGTSEATDRRQYSSWEKLREIEDRLEDEDMGIDAPSTINQNTNSSLPRLRIKAGINPQDLLKSTILPQTILEDLNKPCMQVVLWKPPGIVKDIEEMFSPKASGIQGSSLEDSVISTEDVLSNMEDLVTSSENQDLPSQILQQPVRNLTITVPSPSSYTDMFPSTALTSSTDATELCHFTNSTPTQHCQFTEDDNMDL
ncbi:uncharacterized protein LOC124118057 [Haliotis rufescens]|uniref:uncharacterized protein LOC124118057 n=1 Tax=Haliotis rufescens TaxID=6454 RepID=UPI001EB077E7|nr:uncharacterized protein LOC124118057 [Haliotis rufescens]